MNLLALVYSCILFIVISPNILFKIPSKGSKNIVAVTHAVLFGIVLYFTEPFVVNFSRKNLEGIGSNSSADSSPTTSPSIAGSLPSTSASNAGSSPSSASIAGSSPSTSPSSASIAGSSPSTITSGQQVSSSTPIVGPTRASIAPPSLSTEPTTSSPNATSFSPVTKTEKTLTDSSNTNVRRGNTVVYYVAPSFIAILLITGIAVIVTSRK